MAFVGDLRDFVLPEILQVLVQGKKTGEMTLCCTADATEVDARIVIVRGRILHADRLGIEPGLESFWSLLALEGGRFAFESVELGDIQCPVTIDRTLDSLLFENLSEGNDASGETQV